MATKHTRYILPQIHNTNCGAALSKYVLPYRQFGDQHGNHAILPVEMFQTWGVTIHSGKPDMCQRLCIHQVLYTAWLGIADVALQETRSTINMWHTLCMSALTSDSPSFTSVYATTPYLEHISCKTNRTIHTQAQSLEVLTYVKIFSVCNGSLWNERNLCSITS